MVYSPGEYKPPQVMRWLVGPIPACFVLLAAWLQWAMAGYWMDGLAGEMIVRLAEYAFSQV